MGPITTITELQDGIITVIRTGADWGIKFSLVMLGTYFVIGLVKAVLGHKEG